MPARLGGLWTTMAVDARSICLDSSSSGATSEISAVPLASGIASNLVHRRDSLGAGDNAGVPKETGWLQAQDQSRCCMRHGHTKVSSKKLQRRVEMFEGETHSGGSERLERLTDEQSRCPESGRHFPRQRVVNLLQSERDALEKKFKAARRNRPFGPFARWASSRRDADGRIPLMPCHVPNDVTNGLWISKMRWRTEI